MLRLKDWREVINTDFPEQEVTKETITRAKDYQGQVRKPYSQREYEDWREKVLNTPLP